MSNNDLKTTPEQLAVWLKQAFDAAEVEVIEADRMDVYLFRIRDREERPWPEFEVTLEALEDWDLNEIGHDITSDGLVQWMKDRPSFRIRYGNDRQISHFESLNVRCGGEWFRVVRDGEANVSIFNSANERLKAGGMRVLPTSIFRKSEQQWCKEIEELRSQH